MKEKRLTKQRIVEMLGIPRRTQLSKHADGSYTYRARYETSDGLGGRASEVRDELVRRAAAGGYTLRVREVSRVCAAARGRTQNFTFVLVKNEADAERHNLTLIVASSPGRGGWSGMAALIIRRGLFYNLGLFRPAPGSDPGVEAVFAALATVQRPAVVALVTDERTAGEVAAAREGGGCARTRELLSYETGLIFVPVAPADLTATTADREVRATTARLLRAYEACREAAAVVAERGSPGCIPDEARGRLAEVEGDLRRAA